MALSVGARLGHYEVTAKLGEGGMGEVWEATDTKLDRDVALEVLPQRSRTILIGSPGLEPTGVSGLNC